MLAPHSPAHGPELFLGQISGADTFVAAGALALIGLLAWQLRRTQRLYALDLAEQAAQAAEEQEKTSQARRENATLAGENKAKSEMLATLSREIRGHLNGIVGSADLLLDPALSPRQRAHLATLRASAQSLDQSLTDVLDYSSIETGLIQIAHVPFDLRQPLIEVVETLTPLALLKGLEVVLIVAPDVPVNVVGDSARLRQSLVNLMSNAVKFTAHGRVVLCVTVSTTAPQPAKPGTISLHFAITDTGAGIPEEMHATIFERATETDSASPRNFGGTGLELTISKRLVQLMGGSVGARSLPEGGSELWVELALSAEKEPSAPDLDNTSDLHVVVLDDLAASRVAVSSMLIRMGIDQDATDGIAKAGVLLRDAADAGARELVLLLDYSVAVNRGQELAALAAADATLRRTRIVIMSRDTESETVTGHAFPIAAVLRKPVLRVEALWEALRPATAAPLPARSSRAPFGATGNSKPPHGHGPQVLVVDDDNISRSVTFQLLEILGCAVEVAVSGAVAIERARHARFDLVLMDCHMPDLDGFEATQKILAEAKGEAPPIVALTASASDAHRERCFAAGMSDFIAKPVRKADLARILKRWVPAAAARRK